MTEERFFQAIDKGFKVELEKINSELKAKLETLQEEMVRFRQMRNDADARNAASPTPVTETKKRTMSAAARKKISEAVKQRHARNREKKAAAQAAKASKTTASKPVGRAGWISPPPITKKRAVARKKKK